MCKKLKKLCAWALAVVTVLTVIPSSGMVMAYTEPANAEEVEQGTVYFKVPNANGQIIVSTEEDGSDKQTITVTDEKTTLTDKDGNVSDIALTEEGYSLELTKDVGTVIHTEVIASEGYEVGTYHILSDTGDEIENKSLSSDNKYDVTVSEDVQVVEVIFNAVKTTEEDVTDTGTESTEAPEEDLNVVETEPEEDSSSNDSEEKELFYPTKDFVPKINSDEFEQVLPKESIAEIPNTTFNSKVLRAAARSTSKLTVGRVVRYNNWSTNEFTIDGEMAYCAQPALDTPGSGSYTKHYDIGNYMASGLPQDVNAMTMVLWRSYGSPGFDKSYWPSKWYDGTAMTTDRYIALSHILISDIYSYDAGHSMYGCDADFVHYVSVEVTGYDTNTGHQVNDTATRFKIFRGEGAPSGFVPFILDTGKGNQNIISFEYTPNKYTSLTVTKQWNDNNNQYGARPDSIISRSIVFRPRPLRQPARFLHPTTY